RPSAPVPGNVLQTTVLPPIGVASSINKMPPPSAPPNVTVGKVVAPQYFSLESSPAPYDTLFNDFALEAFPFYNFWTPDELTNDKDAVGDRKLEDIPRFVKVVWNPAPTLPDSPILRPPQGVGKRKNKPTKFSLEVEKGVSVTYKGVAFSPDHLQPVNFSQA